MTLVRYYSPLLFLVVLMYTEAVRAQIQDVPYRDPEERFQKMRNEAASGHYVQAKRLALDLLEDDPGYFDVTLYLARIYGWEGKFDSAYAILEPLPEGAGARMEAYRTLIDLAYWKNDWRSMAAYARTAMALVPDSAIFREKYLLARKLLATGESFPEIFTGYSFDHFRDPYTRNWHMATLGGLIPAGPAKILPSIHFGYLAGSRVPSTDLQLNGDLYLNLGKRNYIMAGYGFSPGTEARLFPRHRAALEAWQVLPAGFGLSAGTRFFYWDRPFTFLTFSGEKYAGAYWFSLRNYLFFKDYGVSGSYYLTARRYLRQPLNYISATLGYGTAPDEPLTIVADLERLRAASVRLGYSWQFRYNMRMEGSAGYAREEYEVSQRRDRLDLRITLFFRLVR